MFSPCILPANNNGGQKALTENDGFAVWLIREAHLLREQGRDLHSCRPGHKASTPRMRPDETPEQREADLQLRERFMLRKAADVGRLHFRRSTTTGPTMLST